MISKVILTISRERLIHLLAVRPYKKPELLIRMHNGKISVSLIIFC